MQLFVAVHSMWKFAVCWCKAASHY